MHMNMIMHAYLADTQRHTCACTPTPDTQHLPHTKAGIWFQIRSLSFAFDYEIEAIIGLEWLAEGPVASNPFPG